MTAWGLKQALAGPQLVKVEVPVKDLPHEFDSLRIAQISDLHVGPTIDEEYVARVVQQVLDTKPDLIAITELQMELLKLCGKGCNRSS